MRDVVDVVTIEVHESGAGSRLKVLCNVFKNDMVYAVTVETVLPSDAGIPVSLRHYVTTRMSELFGLAAPKPLSGITLDTVGV